ncbi:biotin--[acetyl-CoA-carboxylase] ligase [Pseudovibrio sp. Tun.PSC04-5.I4]|uniref:biotin--[acetyl-CoA-carboxylase] ligase n=1 Tax=Pseudovibrio sp. Tun.PSC04-5.I4 TaxID=1798213 RepID=UPI000B838F90|nr:biotin--[acetyl-CoA-carboxylase] ligase [Pseudovibrio sp. Tun.PSC04-5.I4]
MMSGILKDEGPVRSAPGFCFEHFGSIGSTNSYGLQKGRDGHPGNLWVRSDVQLSGRGRRGREWTSEAGNLFASLLLRLNMQDEKIVQLPFVAALALGEAIERATGTHGLVQLKWPNDVLIDGQKISGILLESESGPKGELCLVCGFGVNVSHHPELGDYAVTDLRSMGYMCEPQQVFEALAQSFARWLDAWKAASGFGEIRSAWLRRAVGRGKPIRVRLSNEEFSGVFKDIDQMGRLIVKMDHGGERLVTAGDVFFS